MARTPDSYFRWSPVSKGRNRLTNAYEPLQPYFLSEISKAAGCDLFVDIGANIGFYSIFMAKEIAPRNAYTFEPIQTAVNEVRANIALNSMEDVIELRPIALSSKSGEATMAVISDLSGANSIVDTTIHHDKSVKRTESVPISTLDDELPLSGERVAVKIDVEGHELDVLKGGGQFFANNKVVVQMEKYESAGDSVLKPLMDLGYEKVLSVGPDHYLTNTDLPIDPTDVTEKALARFIDASKAPPDPKARGPLRKKIFRGVTIELSPRLAGLFRTSG